MKVLCSVLQCSVHVHVHVVMFLLFSIVLLRVTEFELKNKMGLSNLVRLFAPTLMTVDGDPVSPDTIYIDHSHVSPYLCRVNYCVMFFAGLI